ncbi:MULTISPECIES: hypothetical protein [unclassified Streptomyces]|uniref:hypothetical protein n=1 Tax=unclassified Streptomyces TaxID=2593676 RepID=UPI0037F9DF28|nr:hypothetical protein OG282_03640 [Streptomyces sp. NBC_01014]
MTRQPSAAQRRAIRTADAESGLLHGPSTVLAALVAQGLALRHPRPPHRHYLTPAGQRVREQLAADPLRLVPPPASTTPPDPAPGVFSARTGTGSDPADSARQREVRSAWDGLLDMRRVTDPDGSAQRPCDWERTHLTQASALALEAGGCRGYLVTESAQPEAVRVDGPDPAAYAEVLELAGWQTSAHADRRAGSPYLLASPRRT